MHVSSAPPIKKFNFEVQDGLVLHRDRPKFGYSVLVKTTHKYGFGLVSVTAKKTVELRFRSKLDHVETETRRNWISSVSCSDLQSDNVIFQKLQWAGLTAWSESSQVYSASPPRLENRKYFL